MAPNGLATAEELFGPDGTPSVVVIGAGFGGIGTGVKLKRSGIHSFAIFESSHGVGGTWWDNTYPGAEVDVHSQPVPFSFEPHDWARTHARRPSCRRTWKRPSTSSASGPTSDWESPSSRPPGCRPERHVWTVRTDDESVVECHVVISAVGFLNVPRCPDWPGLARIRRSERTHTSTVAEHHHDLSDKVVAGVGTGSTATQVVPSLQPKVRTLYLFQREPGWVIPKGSGSSPPPSAVSGADPGDGPSTGPGCATRLEKGLIGAATLPAGHQPARQAAADLSRLHRPGVRRATGPGEGRHPHVSLPGQETGHRQHLLSVPESGQRGTDSEGRLPCDPIGHRRCRRRGHGTWMRS